MKRKIFIALTAIFVLGLAMAVYAFNQTNTLAKAAASCCAKSDNCPLKNKNAAQTAENRSADSCCDKADCCCKNGSCPMKSSGEKGSASCCDNCCGGSCPMKNKDAQMTTMQVSDVNVEGGESCHHMKEMKAGI